MMNYRFLCSLATWCSLAYLSAGLSILTKKPNICVLGAGVSGLAAAKATAEYIRELDLVVFEKSSDVGGLWRYTDSQDKDEHGLPVHSSMYKYLRTNGPGILMEYPDFPHSNEENREQCNSHQYVLHYLTQYVKVFGLRKYIKFNTVVEEILLLEGDKDDWKSDKWLMITRDLETDHESSTLCDGVVVGNGHYHKTNVPKIAGIENFPGKILHSHIYRYPQEFEGKTVLVLGAGFSGIDISQDMSPYVNKIYLSHNKPKIQSRLPKNVEQVAGLASVNGSTLILRDNSTLQADVILFATGYLFSYPFLSNDSGLELSGKYVYPLYKYMLNAKHPSMALVGAATETANYPLSRVQSQYFVSMMRGKAHVPSLEERLVTGKDRELTPQEKRLAMSLQDKQWKYQNELAQEGGFEPYNNDLLGRIYDAWDAYSQKYLMYFKDASVKILRNGYFKIINPPYLHPNAE
ncbi:flavin-containing monooxygenase FMO GS-OX5-like [Trichogramma pretiosum]|uniref:flavin-containing monooxygenase FMO GS-OX5-like n=1 Tax=Trichogramma pretiosum TaxID=7493 RepID=UPI0006C95E56|nr:flavin-containing monooxygenase FMO GS-OX5-like [Trichogramma pretiosum]